MKIEVKNISYSYNNSSFAIKNASTTINENEFKINLKKCIFCGNCTFYCPVKAIKTTKEYELATNDINKLELVYEIKKKEVQSE